MNDPMCVCYHRKSFHTYLMMKSTTVGGKWMSSKCDGTHIVKKGTKDIEKSCQCATFQQGLGQ